MAGGTEQSLDSLVDQLVEATVSKKFRRLCYLIAPLVNPNNHRAPITEKEASERVPIVSVRGDVSIRYLTHKQIASMNEIVEEVHSIQWLSLSVARARIQEELTKLVFERLDRGSASPGKRDSQETVRELYSRILEDVDWHRFYFVIDGLKLEDGRAFVDFGPVRFFTHTKEIIEEICSAPHSEKDDSSGFWGVHQNLMLEHVQGLTGLTFIVPGDRDQSFENAMIAAERCLAAMRAACCLMYPSAATAKRFHLRVAETVGGHSPFILDASAKVGHLSRFCSFPHRGFESLVLSDETIEIIKRNCFDDLFILLFSPDISEFERSIVRAAEWIGDAQADVSTSGAFAKFWIALETLLSTEPDDLTSRLRRSIPTVLVHQFRLISEEEHEALRNQVSRLYRIRGATVHRGKREILSEELSAVRDYASLMLVSFLALRRMGFRSHDEVDAEMTKRYLESVDFVAVGDSKVVHKPTCRYVVQNPRRRLREFRSRTEAIQQGLSSCKACLCTGGDEFAATPRKGGDS